MSSTLHRRYKVGPALVASFRQLTLSYKVCDKDEKQEGTVSVLSGQLRTKGIGKNRERSSKTPQGRKQINPECGTFYRTTDLLSARSQCHGSKAERGML